MIRRATTADIDAVAEIYEHIHDSEENGSAVIGWIRGVYPTRGTAEAALARGDLFVSERNGTICAAAIINQAQVDSYAQGAWLYAAAPERVCVLHTLVVEPQCSSHGVGTEFVAFYETYAKKLGCDVLRMDTNARNAAARRLYAHLGYREAGVVPCVFNGIPDVRLVLLEKKL